MIRVHSEWFGVTEYPDGDGWKVDLATGHVDLYKGAEVIATYRPDAWSRVEDGAARVEGAKST